MRIKKFGGGVALLVTVSMLCGCGSSVSTVTTQPTKDETEAVTTASQTEDETTTGETTEEIITDDQSASDEIFKTP